MIYLVLNNNTDILIQHFGHQVFIKDKSINKSHSGVHTLKNDHDT